MEKWPTPILFLAAGAALALWGLAGGMAFGGI